MNITLSVKCPCCKHIDKIILTPDTPNTAAVLKNNFEHPYCFDCDEKLWAEEDALEHEAEIRRNEQIYGDQWREILGK